jgi:hypothetical protein
MPLDKIAFYGTGWQIHAENLAAHLAGLERGGELSCGSSRAAASAASTFRRWMALWKTE